MYRLKFSYDVDSDFGVIDLPEKMFRLPLSEEQNTFIQIVNTHCGFQLLNLTRFDAHLARKTGLFRIIDQIDKFNDFNHAKLNEVVNDNLDLIDKLEFVTQQHSKLRKGAVLY
jgi:hypothetical protein